MEWSEVEWGVCVAGFSFLFRGAAEAARSCFRLERNPALEMLQFRPSCSSLPFSLPSPLLFFSSSFVTQPNSFFVLNRLPNRSYFSHNSPPGEVLPEYSHVS